MGRMDVAGLRYLSKDELRVLQAVEQGMKNHDLVPVELISSIASLKHGGAFKCLSTLLRGKLLRHDRKKYDGYSLNSLGYDYLAFNTLAKRGVVRAIGRQIGVGKESDVFIGLDDDEENALVCKMHRLGRTSFRKVKEKRDYHEHRKFANWLYLSRLAAQKEIAFMRCLHEAGFPVPLPVDQNRHVVVMSLVDAYPLTQVRALRNPGKVFAKLMELHIRLARCGLVHCDFNEFNVMINEQEELTVIDFPQMVSVAHPNARYYFERDVECLRLFFERRYDFQASSVPTLDDCLDRIDDLDKKVAASGFTKEDNEALDAALEDYRQNVGKEGDEGGADESESESESDEDTGEEERAGQEEGDVGGPDQGPESVSVGGEAFTRLSLHSQGEESQGEEAGAGAAEGGGSGSGDESEESEEGAGGAVAEPSQYDRDADIRRAWRHSGRPAPRGGGREKGVRAKKTPQQGSVPLTTGGALKQARNRVKDRDRHKLNVAIKESL